MFVVCASIDELCSSTGATSNCACTLIQVFSGVIEGHFSVHLVQLKKCGDYIKTAVFEATGGSSSCCATHLISDSKLALPERRLNLFVVVSILNKFQISSKKLTVENYDILVSHV
jgi:hypothetical protein